MQLVEGGLQSLSFPCHKLSNKKGAGEGEIHSVWQLWSPPQVRSLKNTYTGGKRGWVRWIWSNDTLKRCFNHRPWVCSIHLQLISLLSDDTTPPCGQCRHLLAEYRFLRYPLSYLLARKNWTLKQIIYIDAAATAKSLQSCLTLCDPIDGSPPDSPVPRILQARTLEWVAIFPNFNTSTHRKATVIKTLWY